MSYNIGDIVEVKTPFGPRKGEILGYYNTKADNVKLYYINIGNPYLKDNIELFNESQIIGLFSCINPKKLHSVKELAKAYDIAINYDNHINYPSFSTSLLPGIKKVIFNNPATIVLWDDGTKTVVKCDEPCITCQDPRDNQNPKFDPEKGLAMAIAKKVLGNKGNYYNEFKKWLPKED